MPVYGLIFYLLSLFVSGYDVFVNNHDLQIPLLKIINDPTLYPGDPFVQTLGRYASYLWYAVAWGTQFISLERLFFGLFLIERMLVIAFAGYLAWIVSEKSRLATIGAMAMFALVPLPILGDGTIVANYFEQTGLCVALLLLAAAFFYDQKPFLWAVVLAAGFYCNSMYGVYAFSYFGVWFLVDSAQRAKWKTWVAALVLFGVLAFPVIRLSTSLILPEAVDSGLWLETARVRLPHHLFPLTWAGDAFLRFGLILVAILALVHQQKESRSKIFSYSLAATVVCLGWLVLAFLAAYVFKSPALLMLQSARAIDFWCCFCGIALIASVAYSLEKKEQPWPLYTAAFFIAVFIWHFQRPELGLLFLLFLVWQPFRKHVLKDGNTERLAVIVVLLVSMVAIGSINTRLDTGGTVLSSRQNAPLYGVCGWVRENTAKQATFLTHPMMGGFRALAERPVFFSWKDGSAILWDRGYVNIWTGRLFTYRVNPTASDKWLPQLSNNYQRLTDREALELAERFSLSFWLVPTGRPTSLPVVYQDNYFQVLDFRPAVGNP